MNGQKRKAVCGNRRRDVKGVNANMTITQYVIRFNTEFERWEVFTKGCVKRAGEIQPLFVSTDIMECDAFIARREALE